MIIYAEPVAAKALLAGKTAIARMLVKCISVGLIVLKIGGGRRFWLLC